MAGAQSDEDAPVRANVEAEAVASSSPVDKDDKIAEKPSGSSSPTSQTPSDDLAIALKKSNARAKDDEQDIETALEKLPPHERDILRKQLDVPEAKINYISLYRYATAKDLLILVVCSLSAIISGALLPLMTIIFGSLAGLFRDKAIGTIPQDEFGRKLSHFTLYFVYLMIAMFVFTYITTMGFLYLGESLTDKIREQYLRSLLRQNIAFYDKLGPGSITFSLTGQMSLIQKGLSEKVGLTMSALATFFTAFVIGFIRSAKLTGILVSIIVALSLDMGIGASFMVKYSKKSIEAGVMGGSVAEEVLAAVRDTTAFSTQERLAKHYDSFLQVALKWGYKKAVAEALFLAGMFFVVNANYALSFWEGSRLVADGSTSLSAVLTVLLSVMIGSFSLGNVAPNLGNIFGAVSAAAPIFAAIDRSSPINSEDDKGEKLESVKGDIEFRHIKHIYPSRPEVTVMADFSTVCPAGKTTALVGLSGSGKSTVIGLLERFYSPVGGEVLLDGVSIDKLNVRWLRQQISLVSQEPVLFAQTIYQNIANGLVGTQWEDASDEKKRALVEDAAKLANAHDFILNLTDGYDTNVGDKGYLMSGGQRQRIAIARAVISQPKILLLDEATSALDTTAEAQVQLALDRAAHGRTTITIAHRLSTIKNADNIIVMAAGEIVEQGTHRDLLEKRGTYYDLVQAQTLGDSKGSESESVSSKEEDIAEEADLTLREDLQRTRTNKSARSAKSVQKDDEQHYSLWQLFKFIAGFNRPELGISVTGFIISVLGGLITPAQAVLFSKCVTAMSVPPSQYGQMRKDINLYTGFYFMLAVLHSLSYGLDSSIFGVTSERLTRRARLETFRKFLRQEIGWFDREENSAGSLVSYLSTETTHLAGISGTTLSTIIGAVATVVGAFILAIIIAWKLGLVVSSCLPILIYCGYLRFAMLNKFNDRAENTYQEVGNYACEATSLIRTVISLTREAEISKHYHQQILEQRRKSIVEISWSSTLYAASQSLNFGIIALAFWYGGGLLNKGEYSTFQFFLAYSSIIFASQSVGAAFAFSPDVSSARNAAKRMISIYRREPKINWEGGAAVEKIEGSVEFRDVQFSFPTRPNQKILRGLNFTAKPGEYIALVGPSGCGKSTTIALAERFYEPSSGGIFVDGQNIADLNVREYRSHLALVSQEPVLYQGSIRENVVLGIDRDVTEDEIAQACKQANIYDFIQSLPEGFGTVVGSKGSLLSGGQKQRICIARALIRNPRVLLLDEATSALDSESEKVVQDALDVAAKGRTTIAIAHRLSTIQKADAIYVFENGKVIERGTHRELMELKGKYFELVNLQSLGK